MIQLMISFFSTYLLSRDTSMISYQQYQQNRIEVTLDIFISYNEHIQFTCEKEDNDSVPFLDKLVKRCDNNILKTKWYRKPYCSNRFIGCHSYHQKKKKNNHNPLNEDKGSQTNTFTIALKQLNTILLIKQLLSWKNGG